MISRKLILSLTVLVSGVALLGPAVAQEDYRAHGGSVFLIPSKPTKPKKLDRATATLEIPSDINQGEPLNYSCATSAFLQGPDGSVPIKNVKAKWETEVYLLNHGNSSFQVFHIADGVLKTIENFANFVTIPIPPDVTAAIFTDGFESGDISAWILTDFKFTKGKKLNYAEPRCFLEERSR